MTNNIIRKTIVVYSGRFQPPHKAHYQNYKKLVDKFGTENVFIATSNKIDPKISPFNFKEKKIIFTKMFNISPDKIIQVKIPYNPIEIKSKFNSDTTSLIIAVGEKDATRLSRGKYYQKYEDNQELKSFSDIGYVYIISSKGQFEYKGKKLSGTNIRSIFKSDISDKVKQLLFKKLYEKFNEKIFNLMNKKLNENIVLSSILIEDFICNNNISKLLKEVTHAIDCQVDDGPATFYKHPKNYQCDVTDVSEKLGWQVIDFIAGDENKYAGQKYKYDTVEDISFGDVGIRDTTYSDPIKKYKLYIKKIAERVGYEIINWLMADEKKDNIIDDPKSKMAMNEPITQNTSNASDPLEEILSKKWWKENLLKLYTENQDLLKNIEYSNDRILLQCGGAYGRIYHPFDDWGLTFGDLKELIDTALEGKLELMREKTDGQSILITWKDNELRAARNKTHLKNGGAESLKRNQISNMFAGRGAIHDGFTFAMKDLEKSISKLSDKQKVEIFDNGKKFMSLEIIYPETENVIPYGMSMLLFHGVVIYDEKGNVTGEDKSSAAKLLKMIKDINQDVQEKFSLGIVPVAELPKVADFSNQKRKYISKLNSLQKKFKLKNNDNLSEYHKKWWENFIQKQASKMKYNIPNNVIVGLINRWALTKKGQFKISDIKKIDNEKFKDWVITFDKKDHFSQMKKNILPFELLFLELGATILKNLKSLLAVNPDKAIQTLKTNIEKTIKEIENTNDVIKIEKMKTQLNKLNALGGMDVIVPSEGITFEFRGKIMKFTGSFAPINQILGILRFKK